MKISILIVALLAASFTIAAGQSFNTLNSQAAGRDVEYAVLIPEPAGEQTYPLLLPFMAQEVIGLTSLTYPVSREQSHTVITGISMGGSGSARLALKYPQAFGAVAMMETGI